MSKIIVWLYVWILGFIESRGECGLSWHDEEPNKGFNRAYDLGRAFGRKTIAFGFDEPCGNTQCDGWPE